MTALDFRLRSLIKLSGLSNSSSRYFDRIKQYKVDENTDPEYTITFRLETNGEYAVGSDINISGVSGLPTITREAATVSGVTDVAIVGIDRPSFVISYFDTYQVTINSVDYFYLRAYIPEGITANIGTTFDFSGVPAPLDPIEDGTLTAFAISPYMITFRTNGAPEFTPFGIPQSEFPSLSATPVPPNIYPVQYPQNTPGEGALAIIRETSGFVTASFAVASMSPDIGYTEGYLTDHNRESLKVSYEEIEEVERTVDGTLRFHHNASKMKLGVEWRDLPADAAATVDGYLSGKDMLDIYKNNKGSFYIEIYNRDSARKDSSGPGIKKLVRFSEFNYNVIKRNYVISETGVLTDLWAVSVTFEEV